MVKDLCIRETFEKNGEEKTSWNKIGIMIESNGKQYVKLFHIPNQLISVFDQKEKGQNPPPAESAPASSAAPKTADEIEWED